MSWESISPLLTVDIGEVIGGYWEEALGKLKKFNSYFEKFFYKTLLGVLGGPLSLLASKKVRKGAVAVGKTVKTIGQSYTSLFSFLGGFKQLQPIFDVLNIFIQLIGASIMQTLAPILKSFLEIVTDPSVREVLEIIGKLIAITIIPLFAILGGILEFIGSIIPIDILESFSDILSDIIQPMFDIIQSGVMVVLEVILWLIWEAFKWVAIGAAVFINIMIDIINFITDCIDVALNFMFGIGFLIPDIPDIPHIPVPKFAEGGIVMRSTLAQIGESGPEAVIPLDKSGYMGTNITIRINGNIYGEKDLIDKIVGEIEKRKRLGLI